MQKPLTESSKIASQSTKGTTLSQAPRFPNLPPTGFVRLPVVLQLFPVSRSAWWAGIKAGRYPPGVKIGPRTTAWSTSSLLELFSRFGGEGQDE